MFEFYMLGVIITLFVLLCFKSNRENASGFLYSLLMSYLSWAAIFIMVVGFIIRVFERKKLWNL